MWKTQVKIRKFMRTFLKEFTIKRPEFRKSERLAGIFRFSKNGHLICNSKWKHYAIKLLGFVKPEHITRLMCSIKACPKDDHLWKELHEWFVSNAKDKEADVLFIGGDHIALLSQSQFYLESLEPLHCLCFGSFGDTAANLLWRIQHGEVENFTPKVIIVSIGQSDAEVGTSDFLTTLSTIAVTLKEKQPNAELFFLQLIPSGRKENKHRKFVSDVNTNMVATLKGVANVIFIDSTLVDQNREIDAHHLFDFIHLSQAGYQTVFEPVLAAINSVFNP